MASKFLILSLPIIALVSLSFSACADKSVDDYRADKMRENLARIQAKEGVYRGAVLANKDGLSLGTMSIELQADTRVQNSSDNLGTEQQASVRGSLRYSGVTHADIHFEQGYYAENKDHVGEFKVDIPILNTDGGKTVLSVKGTIIGESFTGTVEADGASEYGASFSLIKDGPLPVSQNVQSGRASKLESQKQAFVGKINFSGTEEDVVLTLNYLEKRPEQFFLGILQPTRQVSAEVALSDFQLQFPSYIDERTDTLIGQVSVSSGPASLLCRSTNVHNLIQSWACSLKGGRAKEYRFTAYPIAQNQPKPQALQ